MPMANNNAPRKFTLTSFPVSPYPTFSLHHLPLLILLSSLLIFDSHQAKSFECEIICYFQDSHSQTGQKQLRELDGN